jgi:ribosomal-protein-alanine N-acetyltransferase
MVTLLPHRFRGAHALPLPVIDAPSSGLSIAPARFSDLWTVARLQRRCFRRSLAYRPTTLLMLYVWPRARFLVARAEGQIIGCVIGDVHGGQSRVVSICVDPEWRRRGIGTRLLTEVESRLRDGNLILMVEAGNEAAERLYRKRGYLPVGESRNYYGRGRNGIWMQKTRTPTG